MIRVLLILTLLLGSGYLGVQLSKDPGYVLIAINHWTIESTLAVAVLSAIILFFLLYVLLQLFFKILHFPSRWKSWRSKRKMIKACATTNKGLIEYSEGYWQKAKAHLIKALPNTDAPLINYLIAARAAQKMGDSQLRDHYLREAQQSMPEAKVAVELTQAELQIANHQWEQALATLKHLQDLAPHHPYVLKLLMSLYEEVKDWPQLIALLPDLKRNQILSAYHFDKLREKAYLHAIKDLIRQNQKTALTDFMYNLPKPLYYHPTFNALYCRFLMQLNEHESAEKILRACLRKAFNEELVLLYGLCRYNIDQQLTFAESLIKKAPHSAGLYLSLGRLCMKDQLWGKAKTYLQKSIELRPLPENFSELGKLYEQLNEPLNASDCFKRGLELISNASLTNKDWDRP